MALPVLADIHGKDYHDVLENWDNDSESQLAELEMESFGYDHAMAGSLMAKEWNLPDYLIESISEHHSDAAEINVEPAIRLISGMRYDLSDEFLNFNKEHLKECGIDYEKALFAGLFDGDTFRESVAAACRLAARRE